MLFNRFYLGEFAMVDSWKDKRISAMNRVIKRKRDQFKNYIKGLKNSIILNKEIEPIQK